MTMAERAESTQKAEVWRLEGGGGWRLGGAEANFARDGVDFDAAAAGPDACAKRMFALLFDDDGNVGLDFARDGVRGELEIRVGKNAELPQGGGLRLALDIAYTDGGGGSFGLHRAAYSLNRLRAGEHCGTAFGFARDFDHIRDVDVAHAAHLFADANGVAALFDGRIGDELADSFFRAGEAHAGSARLGVVVHFALGGSAPQTVPSPIVSPHHTA